MKKFLLFLFVLLTGVGGATADVTITWESYPGWVRNNVASVWWVGITTPGTTSDTYKMSEFQFAQETGYGAATRYACISKTGPTTSGAVLAESDVLGVSTNAVTANATEYYTYTLAEPIELTGATTYYMVFLSSNEVTGGKYTVSNQRVSLNTSYGTYAAGTMSSNGSIQSTWTPGFKATLTTNAAYTVTYTCYSTADNSVITSGTIDDVVGTVSAPVLNGYQFSYATDTEDNVVNLATTEITANTAFKFYYNPTVDVTYKVYYQGELVETVSNITTLVGAEAGLPSAYVNAFFTYTYDVETITSSTTEVSVTATWAGPFEFSADFANAKWYKLKMKDANYPTYAAGETPNVAMPTTDANDQTVQWAFIGNPYTGFQIVNRAAGTDLVLGSASAASDGNDGGNTFVTLAAPGSQTCEKFFAYYSGRLTNGFFLFNAEGHAMNLRDGKLAYWTGGYDLGSTFVATEVLEGENLYNELLAEVKAINYGAGLGQYTLTGSLEAYAGNEAALIALIESTYGGIDYVTGAEALQAMIDNKALNMPKAGMFLRMKSAHDTYLSATESVNEAGRLSFVADADASTVFYFDGSKLIDLAKGVRANGRAVGEGANDGVAYWFEESSLAVGKYAIRFNPDGGSNRYLYAWDTSKNYADQNGSNHANCVFVLEEVTTLPVAVSAAEYATLYAPVALAIAEGVTVYTISAVAEGKATLAAVTGTTIPAETAVILKAAEGTYNFAITEGVAAISGNLLEGAVAPQTWTDEFTLQTSDQGVGLFSKAVPYLAGFKAYLPANKAAGVKGILFDTETAVKSIEAAENTEKAIFDLSGRRVEKPVRGLYIVGGKKVIVK